MVIRSSQHGLTKGKTCLTNLNALYDEMTGLADQGKAVKIFNLDFTKYFNTVSQNIFPDEVKYWLDEWIARWAELAELPGSNICDRWHEVQMEASHQ